MRWRVFPFSEGTAFFNMALDEALIETISQGAPPVIRFYGWKPDAVSIGYFQSLYYEVDVERCRSDGVDVVRRITGGGAVFHSNEGEITYSIIAPQKLFPDDIIKSYKEICAPIISALSALGLKAEFVPINDIVVEGRKISGNAQTRRKGVLLQHGTLLYKVDVDRMFSYLKVPDEKIRDKIVANVKERVTAVQNFCDVSREEVYRALLDAFVEGKEWEFSSPSPHELMLAGRLEQKYASPEWVAKK